MRILKSRLGMAREPLIAPFGFKGAYLTELWQSAAELSTADARMVLLETLNALDQPLTSKQVEAADFNRDGDVNTSDVRAILKKLTKQ